LERDPLNGEKVEEMKDKDARAEFITERANFWIQSIHLPGVNYDTYRAAIEHARNRSFYSQVPQHRDFPLQQG
jgi:hypothetical protein